MDLLKRLGEHLLLLGIPGVFLIAFLDSAAVPLVGGPDAVVLLLCWRKPVQAPWIVMAAVLGSVVGCIVLYKIGSMGGRLASVRRDAKAESWALRHFDRHALWATMLSVMAPPPFPMKPAILAAGVMRIGFPRFVIGALSGRILRYSLVGFLGAYYGDEGVQVLKEHFPAIAVGLAACALLFYLLHRWSKSRKLSNIKTREPQNHGADGHL